MKNKVRGTLCGLGLVFCTGFVLTCMLPKQTYGTEVHRTVTASSISQRATNDTIQSYSDGTMIGVDIDYYQEQIILKPGSSGSTKFYFSSDKKNWELLSTNVMDISMLLKPKSVSVYFKGNKDKAICTVPLQGEETTLKPIYEVVNGSGRISVTGANGNVEYRKGANGPWRTYTSPIDTAPYEVKGCTFYFRTVATKDMRAKKIVSIKVSKRSNAPNVKVDGSKLVLSGIKETMEYRVGDNTSWKTFTQEELKQKYVTLASLFAPSSGVNVAIPAGAIEIRTVAKNGKVPSQAKLITTETQPQAPTTPNLTGTTLTILDASSTKPYEYTVVNKINTTLNMNSLKWTAVTKSKPVLVKNASIGDRVLVRLKTTTNKETKVVTPASLFREFIVSSISVN